MSEPLPAWVLLCAETQERYCWAVPWEKREAAREVFESVHRLGEIYPGAGARVVGRTRGDGLYRVTWGNEAIVECPARVLTAGIRTPRPARRRERSQKSATESPVLPRDASGLARELLSGLALGGRHYLYEKYDSDVQGLAVVRRGEAAAGVEAPVPGAPWGLAMSVAGNPAYGAADPYLAAAHAVCEAARRVVSVGAVPWALTDCMNFGSALSPEVMGDFEAAIDGLADAARALGTEDLEAPLPFVSGNVSLYNQDEKGYAIPPSPIVACLGRVADLARAVSPGLKASGSVLVYAGPPRGDLSGSAVARHLSKGRSLGVPPLDLEGEAARQRAVRGWIEGEWVLACHSIGTGGVTRALFAMCAASPERRGAIVEWPPFLVAGERLAAWWSEEPGFLLEVEARTAPRLLREASAAGVAAVPIGQVRPEWRIVDRQPGEEGWRLEMAELVEPWRAALAPAWRLSEAALVGGTA